MCGMKLLIHSHTSNGETVEVWEWISNQCHTLLTIWSQGYCQCKLFGVMLDFVSMLLHICINSIIAQLHQKPLLHDLSLPYAMVTFLVCLVILSMRTISRNVSTLSILIINICINWLYHLCDNDSMINVRWLSLSQTNFGILLTTPSFQFKSLSICIYSASTHFSDSIKVLLTRLNRPISGSYVNARVTRHCR